MTDHSIPVVCTVRVMYAFTAKEEGDLTLNKGDIIQVHDNDGGWWKGTLLPDGDYGIFPSNFVEVIDTKEDSTSKPLTQNRQHSRQSSVDSSKFTKRKPVKNAASSTSSLPYSGSNNTSSASIGVPSRKNPQAIIGDSGLCSTMPGAFPVSSSDQPQAEITNEAVYSPRNSDEQQRRRNSAGSTLLSPHAPSPATTLSSAQSGISRHVSNRFSMPNLTRQQAQQDKYRSSHARAGTSSVGAEWEPPHASHLPQGNPNGGYEDQLVPFNQENEQHFPDDSHLLQPRMMPHLPPEYYYQPINPQQHYGYGNAGQLHPTQRSHNAHPLPQPGNRHSIATTGICLENYSELSLENLAKHNRSQGALDPPKTQGSQGLSYSRSRSQANIKSEGIPVFYLYNQQPSQQEKEQPQARMYPGTVSRKSMGPRTPNFNIVIPQPKGRPQSIEATRNENQSSSSESSPVINSTRHPGSPQTPGTADSSGAETPKTTATSMSDASAAGARDFSKKSETARIPPSNFATASTYKARKFSVDSNRGLGSSSMPNSTAGPEGAVDAPTSEESSEDVDFVGTYTAKKPKTTLFRAFKQIINPKKVAEKDALRTKNEHFAWIEMQKSLKRASSPEPGKERPFFAPLPADDESQQQLVQDPFEVLKKCQVMRDANAGPGATTGAIDFGLSTFVQVDKVARNVNQRGNHLTPQLLSQKYLTRPYSKSPLSKLRVLFVWVSENIKLEGDISGGRYKLGPAGGKLSTFSQAASAAGDSLAATFMAGVEECTRSFLREDAPELAQDVLTSRTCRTGEGYANLFAEMAIAAGIEDVGVVKGYLKGPMDAASSFYFLTSPMDLVMSHSPLFLTYQYITPSIPPQIFLQLPFVRPALFEFGLSLPDFKRRTKLDIKDDEPIEVVIRIDGGGGLGAGQGSGGVGRLPGLFGGDCLGRGCGEGIELRAEVEAMNKEGKIVRKRALAQIMILNPYQQQQVSEKQGQGHLLQPPQGPGSSMLSVASTVASAPASIAAASNKSYQAHHCTGIRIAKVKAVLPSETVVGPEGFRKGVVHIYAGRKVEIAPGNATPYSLALSLPIRHTGTIPKTPFSFVQPHFSPYEFYVKAPQAEVLYSPHTYKFSIVSLAAQAQATLASANAISENDSLSVAGLNNSMVSVGSTSTTMTSNSRLSRPMAGTIRVGGGGMTAGSSSLNPMYKSRLPKPQPAIPLRVGTIKANAQSLMNNPSKTSISSATSSVAKLSYSNSTASTASSVSTLRGGSHKNYPYQHGQLNSTTFMASTSSSMSFAGSNGNGISVPKPERLVLRTQTNRIYKLTYNPVRQCHEAQVEVKERGIWECVRMDEGGKTRVGREGTGVVIASWRCV
ncbi:cytokinesis protein 3 [Modicella reniformis]|uniref:Cytokinesis protein 3 n=1 Tax=Modicella reniformis TaxID=1440133 RepID=A0A9P6ML02_9FUNG|nr:cytokinesis protein 3 [Modicella reniformis]